VKRDAPAVRRQLEDVTEKTAGPGTGAQTGQQPARTGAAAEFERLYRANIDGVTAYQFSTQGPRSGTGQPVGVASKMTSGPAPNCVSIPAGWQHPVADGSTPGSHSADGPGRAPATESDGSPGSTPASQSAGGLGSTPVTHSDGGAVSNS